jgi:hypothetical protein
VSVEILLLHPPAVKPSEPPLGAAILLGALRRKGFAADALDANLGAYLYLLGPERLHRRAGDRPATALKRALRHLSRSLALMRSFDGAASLPRYATAVSHLEEALTAWGETQERLSLGDYVHSGLCEFSPADLERLAAGEASTLFAPYFREELLPRIEQIRPRLVALSVNYRHQVLPAFELAGMLRRRIPRLQIVAGGGMFTSWREAIYSRGLRFSCFDHVVFGPGEGALASLAAGGATDYFLEGSEEIHFSPDFSFAALGEYLSPVPLLPVSTSRGCYWRRCLFCPEASAPTHPYRSLAPEEVPSLLRELSNRFGVRHFHLTDNAVPMPILSALGRAKTQLAGLSWHGFARFEEELCDPDLVRDLAQGGCRMLQLGLESASPAVLDRLGKGTRPEVAARVLKNLSSAGIASYVYVLLGTPGESEEDAEATRAFLEEHAGAISFLNLAIMNLPRGSRILDDPDHFGIAAAETLSETEPLGLYRTFTPVSGWGREQARRFLQRRLLATPAIRAIAQRTPPAFTSNHAFLFG